MSAPELRDLTPADLERVVELEPILFPEPWSQRLYEEELALRSGRRYRAAVSQGELLGWSGVAFAAGEAHLLTLATIPEARRRGIARHLLADQIEAAIAQGIERMLLEVAVSNTAARGLYAAAGFAPIGIRRQYYRRSGEDALVLERDLHGSRR